MTPDRGPLPLPEPPLGTAAVLLRPWRSSDLSTLVAAGADPVVARYRTSVPAAAIAAAAWLERIEAERARGARLELAVCPAGGAAAAGSISLEAFVQRNAAMSFWLAPGARGKGVMTAAVGLLAPWGFATLGLARIALEIDPENAASCRVAERCGFHLEGQLRSHWDMPDGRRVDSLQYGLLPGETVSVGQAS